MLQRFQGVLQVLRGQVGATRGRIMSAVGQEAMYRFPNHAELKEQLQQYIYNPLEYISDSRIATFCATVEVNVMRETESSTPGETKKVRVVGHWLEKLLAHPNSWQSKYELFEATFAFYSIAGNCYWYMNGREEIIVLRPDRIRIVAGPDTKNYISGYVYTVNSVDIPLMPQDVIHFKKFHPLDDFIGLSPTIPAAVALQADMAMARWNRGYFGQNNGVPPNMVSVEPNVTDTEFERLQEDFSRNYGANLKERKTMFVRGGSISFTDMAKNQKEMEFLLGRKYNKEEVMLIKGIPPGILDVNATEANALAGNEVFTEQTTWPIMTMFCQKLTATLLFDEGLILEPVDIRVKNATAQLKEMQAAAAVMSTDELRARYFDMAPATWDGHDKPPAGADAPIPSPVGGKPNVDKSPEQIAQADSQSAASPFKALETEEQRKWFFANNPGLAASGSTPHLEPGADRETHRQALEKFAETSKNRVANHLWDSEMIGFNEKAQIDVNPQKTREAAAALVKDTRDASLPRDYLVSSYREVRGVDASDQSAEGRLNAEKASQAQAILVAGQVGNVSFTDAQNRYLQSVASGNYLKEKYGQYASGARGTLIGTKPTGGGIGHSDYAQYMRQVHRDEFREVQQAHKALDVEPVYITGPIRDEIKKFQRFAAKGKSVETFRFNHSPRSIEIAYKAQADINELDYLTVKAILPASARVSISGVRDPNAKEKEQSATTLASAFHAALSDLQGAIVDGVKHVAAPDEQAYLDYFDSKWWKSALAAFVAALYATYYDALEVAAQDSADISSVQSGVGFDDASLAPLVRDAADSWSANWLPGIVQTTRAAFEAMLARWASAMNAKIADLVSAVQESPVFGEDRATLAGETENTSLWMMAAYLGASVVAGAVQGVSAEQVDDISHPHPGCVCYLFNGVWYAVHDGHKICETCAGRDGKTLQEIQDGGL